MVHYRHHHHSAFVRAAHGVGRTAGHVAQGAGFAAAEARIREARGPGPVKVAGCTAAAMAIMTSGGTVTGIEVLTARLAD